MTREEILNGVKEAVKASGKMFSEIGKESFFSFFEKEGFPKKNWDSLYNDLVDFYKNEKSDKQESISKQEAILRNIDYYSSTHNDVKKRTPRKSIFSEIVKIAG